MWETASPISSGAVLAGTSTGPNSARVTLKSMKRDDQVTTIVPAVTFTGCSLYSETETCASIGDPRDGGGEPMDCCAPKLTQYWSAGVLTQPWVAKESGSCV